MNFEYFIAGFGVLLLLCVFFGIFAGFITNMIGFIYPGYMTLLALDGDHEGIQTNWLIYWAMYSVLTLVEDYGEFIIYWVPFYYPIKAAFLIYMMVGISSPSFLHSHSNRSSLILIMSSPGPPT